MEGRADAGKAGEFRGVQALRGVAALAVVAGHSNDFLKLHGGVPPALAWLHGPAGVDIFFVISGFVMMFSSGRLLQQPHPARLFLWRRLIRIAPLYWLLTAVRLVLVYAFPGVSVHGRPSLWYSLSSFLFIPAAMPDGLIRPVIPSGWTLSYEMMFYLIFALALLRGGRRRLLVTTVLVVLLGVVGALAPEARPAWTSLADPIVLEFAAGVWIAELCLRGWRVPGWLYAAAIAVGVLALAHFSFEDAKVNRAFIWGPFAALIVWGIVGLEQWLARGLPRWALTLGDASYSIYLVQMFVFPPVHALVSHLGPAFVETHGLLAGLLMIALNVPLAAAAGLAVHHFVEKPMTSGLRRRAHVARPQAVTP